MTLTRSPFYLRPMAVGDLSQIAEIEAESFPSAWPSSAYKREMERNNLARYIVAVRHDPPPLGSSRVRRLRERLRRLIGRGSIPPAAHVAGFLGVWFMVDETHIVTVAVRASERRQGVGELLLLAAFDLSRERDIPALTLEVRASNVAAQALYEKYGFKRLGIRKRYYTDNNEDAVIMTTLSLDDADYAARVEELRREHDRRWGRASDGS